MKVTLWLPGCLEANIWFDPRMLALWLVKRLCCCSRQPQRPNWFQNIAACMWINCELKLCVHIFRLLFSFSHRRTVLVVLKWLVCKLQWCSCKKLWQNKFVIVAILRQISCTCNGPLSLLSDVEILVSSETGFLYSEAQAAINHSCPPSFAQPVDFVYWFCIGWVTCLFRSGAIMKILSPWTLEQNRAWWDEWSETDLCPGKTYLTRNWQMQTLRNLSSNSAIAYWSFGI